MTENNHRARDFQRGFDHEAARGLVQRSLDARLTDRESALLEEHLAACSTCRDYAHRARAFHRRLAQSLPLVGRGSLPPVSGADLLARMQRRSRERAAWMLAGGLAGLALLAVLVLAVSGPRRSGQPLAESTPTRAQPPSPAGTVTPAGDPAGDLPRGLLAFESWESGNADIYLIRADGSGKRNLTGYPARDVSPRWSPQGDRLAFISDRGMVGSLYIYDFRQQRLRLLAEARAGEPDWSDPSWSPDGRLLAAVRAEASPQNTFRVQRGDPGESAHTFDGYLEGPVYVLAEDGSSVTKISGQGQLGWNPQWSPDGSRVFFNTVQNGYARIFSARPDGTDLRPFGSPDGRVEQGTFALSPDGQHAAYFLLRRSRGGPQPDRLVLARLDGSGEGVLEEFSNHSLDLSLVVRFGFLSWSPDGTRLAYVPPASDDPLALRVLDLAAGTDTLVYSGLDLFLPQYRPAWSPDGRWLTLVADGALVNIDAGGDLSAPGRGPVRVYEDQEAFGPGSVHWQPVPYNLDRPGSPETPTPAATPAVGIPTCASVEGYLAIPGVLECREILDGYYLFTSLDWESTKFLVVGELENRGWQRVTDHSDVAGGVFRKDEARLYARVLMRGAVEQVRGGFSEIRLPNGAQSRVELKLFDR